MELLSTQQRMSLRFDDCIVIGMYKLFYVKDDLLVIW